MRTRHLHAVIETAETNYAAYVEEVGGVGVTGDTLAEVKKSLQEALDFLVDSCEEDGDEVPEELQGPYVLDFRMDVKSFLQVYYGIFTKAGLERLTGINQKQLWHYANGKTIPRRAQVQKIENALHQLGEELISIRL